jgi:ATP-dependent Lhr-like helicase
VRGSPSSRRPGASPSSTGSGWRPSSSRTARALRADDDAAIAEALRGHLALIGPSTDAELRERTGLSETQVERGIAALEVTGYAMRGAFDPARSEPEVCARHLLARIHGYTQKRLRSEIEPVSARDFMRFLLRWQCVAPGTRREGRAGTLAAIRQLQGLELAAGAWETSVLPARVAEYRSSWLDDLCWSGDVVWGRLGVRGGKLPSRATPIALSATRRSAVAARRAARGGDPRGARE